MRAAALLGALLAAAPVLGDDGRGFIGFVQQGELPWRPLLDLPEGLRARVLSESPGGGPASGTKSYAIWLMRTPRALEVTYPEGCPAR